MIEKAGRAFAGPRSRWITLLVWIAVAIVLTLTLPAVGEKEQNNAANLLPDSPSVLAEAVIKDNFPSSSGFPALLVWHRSNGLIEEDYALIQHMTRQLSEQPMAGQGRLIPLHEMPLPALMSFVSEDGTTFVQPIPFQEGTDTETLKESMEHMKQLAAVGQNKDPFAAAVSSGDLAARISGPAGISVDAVDLFTNADIVLLIATVLLVLTLLLVIYRSPVLALIPLVGVGFAYSVTSPLLGWMAGEGWITVDSQAIAIMTVLLFGAGTDYCLFFITRFRQELYRESDRTTALMNSFKGASGAIAMSGFTVVLALFALLAAHYGAYERFAVPFSLSILIMMIASLTLVPALMAIIGRASFFPFIPRTQEMEKERAERRNKPYRPRYTGNRIGDRVGRLVVDKPWTVVLSCVVVLGGLAAFSSGIKYTFDLLSSFPEDMPSREGFAVMAEAYAPGELAPVTVVVHNPDARADVASKLAAVPYVDHVREPDVSGIDPNLIAYSVVLGVNPYSGDAMNAIPQLREAAYAALPGTDEAVPNDKVWIGGQTAAQYDTKQLTDRDNAVIMPLVIGLIMILLLLYLRSIVAAIYLIGTVLLSYVAALGLGWIIIHHIMGYDAIQGAIPLYAFVFLIALGEDYNIFMISSIWQKRKTMPLRQAIKEGVSATGGVITSAGLILAATFAVLATLPIQVLVQFGIITAIGVLMDTFIVRPFLVPAITTILGKAAFWPGKPRLVREQERETH